MKVIVPMAGMGKRLRPHTLTTPKPLIPVAGKPIVQRLVEDIVSVSHQKVEEVAYVVGRFGEEAERHLIEVAERLGARGTIHYQDEPLGTAHAILCAASALDGPVTVAFADTLFRADFQLDTSMDGVLWVQKIQDPRQFGVVIVDDSGVITEFREKPVEFVSDLAMIGIYYFRDGAWLKRELNYLIDNGIKNGGEYQLPDALRNMVRQGARFAPGAVADWMDCGNKDAVVDTNQKVLRYSHPEGAVSPEAHLTGCTIHQPCFIGAGARLDNCTVGPYASIGEGAVLEGSVVRDSIILKGARIRSSHIEHSMVGSFADIRSFSGQLSLGDHSVIDAKAD